MDTMMKIGKTLTILLIVAGFFACNDDDNSVPFEVIGDVFVIKRNINDEDNYATAYAAYGNQPMSHAEVTTPNAVNLTLDPLPENLSTYSKEPVLDEYSTSAPVEGNYQFLVINEDITHQANDLLDFDNIVYTTITSAEVSNQLLAVHWETNDNADNYVIRLINEAGEMAFVSQLLPVQMTSLQEIGIGTANGSWQETPEVGNVYNIELLTIRYEDDAINSDAAYNFQEIAVTEQEITWQ